MEVGSDTPELPTTLPPLISCLLVRHLQQPTAANEQRRGIANEQVLAGDWLVHLPEATISFSGP